MKSLNQAIFNRNSIRNSRKYPETNIFLKNSRDFAKKLKQISRKLNLLANSELVQVAEFCPKNKPDTGKESN